MSSKTRTRTTRTAATSATERALRTVPDQSTAAAARTDAEDKLWAALHTHPNSTAADLSTAAKIGKSTAQKTLARWAADGSVTRAAGIAQGSRRAADLWAITDVDTTQADPTPLDTAAQAAPDAPDANVAEGSSVEPPGTTADDAQKPDDPDTADLVEAELVVVEVTEPAAVDSAECATTDGADTTSKDSADPTGEKAARLAPGALRGMVEHYLRDHPGEQFGPTTIANALGGKSSGAVSNALDKLVEDGVATKTQDKPRRFALAPAEQEAAPAPTN